MFVTHSVLIVKIDWTWQDNAVIPHDLFRKWGLPYTRKMYTYNFASGLCFDHSFQQKKKKEYVYHFVFVTV